MSHPKLDEWSFEESGGALQAPPDSFYQNRPHLVGTSGRERLIFEMAYVFY
jgi:hypothetical protein